MDWQALLDATSWGGDTVEAKGEGREAGKTGINGNENDRKIIELKIIVACRHKHAQCIHGRFASMWLPGWRTSKDNGAQVSCSVLVL